MLTATATERPPSVIGAPSALSRRWAMSTECISLSASCQHGELVAAQPRGGVNGAHAVFQAAAELPEGLITGVMPERVVDVLEVVHVEEQHRNGHAIAPLAGQRVLDAVAQQRAVGQAGERVVEGLVLELGLE